jgi:hypothetical protein
LKSFQIGKGVSVDLDVLVNSRLMVQANSGSGKSWLLRRLLEQSHGHVQQIVIDPEGEFTSLREKFDYVLAAKSGGDTSADPRTAKLLAERLLELGVSAVIDIYELKAHERIRFVRLFLEALVDSPKHLWHPALIVVDEAHTFCPQVGEAESMAAVRELCSRGRKRGFCAVLATQRISKLHKDAVAECNNKLIGRSSLDVDMKRSADELGFTGREQQQELRTLEPGEFFAFGPAISPVVTRVVVGDVQTSHPKAGSKLAAVVPPPTSKIKALLPKLADLPMEAEAREKSVADLKAEVADLRRQLKTAPKAAPTETKTVKVYTLKDGQLARAERLVAKAKAAMEAIGPALVEIGASLAKASVPTPPPVARPTAGPVIRTPRIQTHNGDAGLSNPEQRIVDAIAWLEDVGVDAPEQPAVSFLAGYSYGSGAFNNPRGSLRVKGYVEYRPGNRIALTDAGRAVAHHSDVPLTNAAMHERILSKLPNPEQRVLRPLLERYPEPMGQAELAGVAGYAVGSGAFNNPRGRLRTLGLIDYPQPGMAVARSILFVE